MVGLPVFALSGLADMAWHTVLGVETATDIFSSPSHLGLLVAVVVIVTSPLRSAWADPGRGTPPWPAVVTLGLATTLVLLFLSYGNALTYDADGVVGALSDTEGPAPRLAARMVVTTIVLLAPLLLLARRWTLPTGAATVVALPAVLLSTLLAEFENLSTTLGALVAALLVDVLARVLRPTAARRTQYWAFAAAAAFVTWALFVGAAAATAGRLPAVPELWSGAPVVAALVGWALAVLMLPTALTTVQAEQGVGGAG